MIDAPPVPPPRSFSQRVLVVAVRWGSAALLAFGLQAVARWGRVRLPQVHVGEGWWTDLGASCGVWAVSTLVSGGLTIYALLRHVEARRPPFGVPMVLATLAGFYLWQPDEVLNPWTLLVHTGVPIVAAVLALAEIRLRRLPGSECGTAWLLCAATVLHQLAWYSLWVMSRI